MEPKKATFNLDVDLHQELKVTAALQRREMVELVRDALSAYLGWNRMTEIEHNEMKLYELAESQGKGQLAELSFGQLLAQLGTESAIVSQLLDYLQEQHRLRVDVWDGSSYRSLRSFGNTGCLYHNGGNLHVQLMIPGRMRYQLLQQRQAWEATSR